MKQTQMTVIGTDLSIVTVNCNNVQSPIKMHRISEWIKKYNPTLLSARNSILMIGVALKGKDGERCSKQTEPRRKKALLS